MKYSGDAKKHFIEQKKSTNNFEEKPRGVEMNRYLKTVLAMCKKSHTWWPFVTRGKETLVMTSTSIGTHNSGRN